MTEQPTWRHVGRTLGAMIAIAVSVLVGFAETVAASVDEKAPNSASARGTTTSPTWYVLALGRLQDRLAVAHYWSSEKKFRALTVIGGRPVLTIVNGPYYYTIDVAAKIGVRIRRNPMAIASDGRYPRPFAVEWDELMAAGGEKVKVENVAGRSAEVWKLTNNSGRRTVWVSQQRPMVPVRVETYDRKTSRRDSVDYVNWQHGIGLPEGFFEPSPGIAMQTLEYDEYITAARKGPVGPAPPLYRQLLHGDRTLPD